MTMYVVEILPVIPDRGLRDTVSSLPFWVEDRKNLTAWVNGDNLVNAVASVHKNVLIVVAQLARSMSNPGLIIRT